MKNVLQQFRSHIEEYLDVKTELYEHDSIEVDGARTLTTAFTVKKDDNVLSNHFYTAYGVTDENKQLLLETSYRALINNILKDGVIAQKKLADVLFPLKASKKRK